MSGGLTQRDSAATAHLARLVAARICHDLSGPLGGLGAALGEADADPSALELARDAGLVLRQRLALLRAAWGGEPAPLTQAALRDLAGGLPNAPRLHFEFDDLEDAAFAPAAGPLVATALILAAESLPGGGMLAMAGKPAGAVVLTIAGPRAAWPVGLGAMLASEAVAREAIADLAGPAGLRTLPAPMIALLAREAGVRAALLLAVRPEQAPPLLLDFAGIAAV